MNLKFLKTILFVFTFITCTLAQRGVLPFSHQNINSSFLMSIENKKAPVTLTQIPTEFYRNNDTTVTGDITIAWDTPGINGNFYYSRFPNVASNLRTLSVFPGDSVIDDSNADNSITFNVADSSITTGVYYCIIVNPAFGLDSTSVEFNMIIEHDLSPSPSDSVLNGQFEWTRGFNDSRTPYFHLMVSNKPLELVNNSEGGYDVRGINIIYQAITPNTSLTYGEADPSGYYDNSKSPRLASGNTYYWLLFNNYGNNPALSSDLITYSEVPGFLYDNPSTMQPAPQNIEPVSTTITNLDTVKFTWSEVSGSYYHFYLYEEIEESNNIGSFLVYDTTITNGDTSITINHLKQLLINTNYYWNVTAENGNLFSASQVDSFDYTTVNAGMLDIETNVAITGNPNLGRVNLDIQLLGGTTPSSLTYLTDESGNFHRDLVEGNYAVSASKEGYSTLDTIVTITNNDTTNLLLNMVGNPTYFTGKIRIPDTDVVPRIKLISSTTDDTLKMPGTLWNSTGTSAEYTFRANVEPGDWTLFPIADGFKAAEGDTADTTIFFGDYLEIPYTFLLEEIESRIIVNVSDDTGGVIPTYNLVFTKGANQQVFNSITVTPFIGAFDPGIWTVTVSSNGYFSQSEQYQVEVFPKQDSYLDIFMIKTGNIRGTVYDDSNQPLDFVTIQANPLDALARYAETTSAANGSYGPLNLKPGNYQITAEKNGYGSSDTTITIASEQTINYNPILTENKSYVTGVVTDTTGVPIVGARVNYLYDMGTGFSNPTDSSGNYLLSVPSDVSIKVYATKQAFSTSDTSYISLQVSQTDTIDFQIYKLNSIVNGTVRTIDHSMLVPMPNVIVSAIDTISMTTISFDTTDQSGYYKLYADAGTFFIQTQKQYYITQQDTVTLISGDSVTVDFLLDKNYGIVSGIATTNTSSPVINQEVTARRSSTGAVLRDTTDSNGYYRFANLEPGEVYTFETEKTRYTIDPQRYEYLVLGGIDSSGFDFTFTRATITSIEITWQGMPDNKDISNTNDVDFNFVAREGSEIIDIEPPLWTIEYSDTVLFETAQFSNTTNGLFQPKLEALDYGISITVEDTAGEGLKNTVSGFLIYSNLNRGLFSNQNIELKNHSGMELIVDSTDIPTRGLVKFQMNRESVPETKAISSDAESYGKSYNLSYRGGDKFISPVILKLPIPLQISESQIESQSQGINVGRWNNNFLEWEILENSDLQTLPYYAVSNTISGDGEYIVLITSQPLGIHNLKILPNPFSPNLVNLNDPQNRNLTGQVITFDLTSLDIRQPFVTAKIYNMNGELVRELADQEPITKGQVALIWDGKANSGKMARNGRYIVHLKVKDSTGEKEKIKSSVLIK